MRCKFTGKLRSLFGCGSKTFSQRSSREGSGERAAPLRDGWWGSAADSPRTFARFFPVELLLLFAAWQPLVVFGSARRFLFDFQHKRRRKKKKKKLSGPFKPARRFSAPSSPCLPCGLAGCAGTFRRGEVAGGGGGGVLNNWEKSSSKIAATRRGDGGLRLPRCRTQRRSLHQQRHEPGQRERGGRRGGGHT